MNVLTASSSSGWAQRSDSAPRPRSWSFLIRLHIGAPDTGWLNVLFSFELLHALVNLASELSLLTVDGVTGGVGPT